MEQKAMAEEKQDERKGTRSPLIETRIILAAFLFSGAAALIYEVIWTRTLSLVLGSTVYALSTMLSTFMAGLAIGAYIGGKISDRGGNLVLYFGLCELGIAVSGLASIPLIYALPSAYLALYRSLHLYPVLFFTVQILMCALVMLVPTTLMGATFPLVARKVTSNLNEMGRKVGDAYSLNTIGAVIGSLAVGFFLIPSFGIKGATAFAASLNLLVAITMILFSGKTIKKLLPIAILVFLPAVAWESSAQLETSLLNFYYANRELDGKPYKAILAIKKRELKPIFYEEYPQGAVRGYRKDDGSFLLQVGGKIEGTSLLDVPNTVLLAYLPIASHPEPKRFLNIGLGAGITLGAAKEQIQDIDLVEINPGVVKAVAAHGRPGLLDGVNIIVNDARNYLLTTETKYDIISSEPSYPTEFEVASLFTRQYFAIAARKLSRNGIYCQWLPYYILTNDDVTMMIKTFGSVFPYVYLWKVPASMDLIMLGSREPFLFGDEQVRDRVGRLNASQYTLDYVLSRTPRQVEEIVGRPDIPINTDEHSILEFRVVNNLLMGDLSLAEGNRK